MHLLGVETNIQHLPSRQSGVAQPYSSRRSARIRELPQPRHHRFWKCVSTDNHDLTLRTVRHDHAGRTRREYHQHELPLESASTNRGSFPSAHPRKPVCLRWLRAHVLSQVLRIGYTLSAKSGLFAEACREWRKIATPTKPWKNFKHCSPRPSKTAPQYSRLPVKRETTLERPQQQSPLRLRRQPQPFHLHWNTLWLWHASKPRPTPPKRNWQP